jgi:hypothetical protein
LPLARLFIKTKDRPAWQGGSVSPEGLAAPFLRLARWRNGQKAAGFVLRICSAAAKRRRPAKGAVLALA